MRAHVLIVEDSMHIARVLNRALSLPQGGEHSVEICDSAETALERLRGDYFDLLISDLRLPGMNGLELLKHTREISPQTKSVLITAFGSPQIEEQARPLTDAYVPKPFRLHDIIRIVQRILDESAVQSPMEEEAAAVPVGKAPVMDGSRVGHLKVLACDLDGTLAQDGRVDTETWEMLRRAKIAGLAIIVVTGRTLDSFAAEGPYTELCEAIVAEDGAVVYFPRRDVVTLPFGRLGSAVLECLEALDVPLERGRALVATRVPHDEAILEALRARGGGAVVEYNRGAVMVLPPGATKGTGLRYALQELGYSPRNVVACGDAENDRSLFEVVELAVAVSNALPDMRALADVVLPQPNGEGVQALISELIAGRVPAYRPRPDRYLLLGQDTNEAPVHLDPVALVNGNLGIFGASGSGKSWLAGLLAEEMLKQEYQACIIDPEGDYRALGTGPHTLLLGGLKRELPSVVDVVNFLENGCISLVLDLSVYALEERTKYILELLRALRGLRARRGRPHWFLVDEVQSFCPSEEGPLTELLLDMMPGIGVVSYRPSQVALPLLEALDYWLVTRFNLRREIEVLERFLGRRVEGSAALSKLPALPIGQAYLGVTRAGSPASVEELVRFHVESRTVPHIRHMHKYLRAPLPASKRFYFHDESGRYLGRAAANLWEFREALGELTIDSLRHHLRRGDFERWLRDVLHDDELARRVRKVGSHNLEGETLRQSLLEIVVERYEELDSLA